MHDALHSDAALADPVGLGEYAEDCGFVLSFTIWMVTVCGVSRPQAAHASTMSLGVNVVGIVTPTPLRVPQSCWQLRPTPTVFLVLWGLVYFAYAGDFGLALGQRVSEALALL